MFSVMKDGFSNTIAPLKGYRWQRYTERYKNAEVRDEK